MVFSGNMFMNKKLFSKKNILVTAAVLITGIVLYVGYAKTVAPTKVALINFQKFQTTSIIKSNEDSFIKVEEVSLDELKKLKNYDAVIAFGMGMRIDAEQRALIQDAADKGVAVYTMSATNPENNICNLDSLQMKTVQEYLSNGNRKNYANLLRYIRSDIDGKTFFVNKPDSVVESASDVFYHLDEDVALESFDEYENYLKEHDFYKDNAPKVAIVGGLNDPYSGNRDNLDSLIISLQNSGLNVYPISSTMKRLKFLKEVDPDAVIYFAHGRLLPGQADAGTDWLKERNIPIFCPLSILQTVDEWMADPTGMIGGFLSQSVVMPELDGAIYPYVINAQYIDKDGLYVTRTVPDRLKSFIEIINNHISLKNKPNSEKKVAIYFFKGVGRQTLTSQGLESVPALYNVLKRLKSEGYKIDNLPLDVKSFEKMLMLQGQVSGSYSKGAFDEFLEAGNPALVEKTDYETWTKQSLSPESYSDVVSLHGEAPGEYMSVAKNGRSYLAVARIELGNIVLLPQPPAGGGSDEFAIVHGTKTAPPHAYIAAYLWSKHAFKADALLHFGTHGSLEFTPQKQVALDSNDWPDRLVGTTPHFYYYTIANIGESMMAKRRSYATLISYLTPPFTESETRNQFKVLNEKIRDYYNTTEEKQAAFSLEVKKIAMALGLHRDLRLDSVPSNPYTVSDIERIENFAEEIASEKMQGQLYVTGMPYEESRIRSSVKAMSVDPIAYSLAALDKQRKKATEAQLRNKTFFTNKYAVPAEALVNKILNGQKVDDALICSAAGITEKELADARESVKPKKNSMAAMMAAMQNTDSIKNKAVPKEMADAMKKGKHPSWIPKIGKKPDTGNRPGPPQTKPSGMPKSKDDGITKEQRLFTGAVLEIERTLTNVVNYKNYLKESPEAEMKSLINALNGGYTAPSSGGDAIANPKALPTGRNLYAINAEATPSESAWDKGTTLVDATLEQYKKQHGTYPRKVSYTFWSSEFIESEGTTIAQVLYMLGVEPVRDAFGRVTDLQLIPSETLNRPRIDVVVQTSGQFRDLAASRLILITRAVEMAAGATGDKFDNFVSAGNVETERQLVEAGISPKEARELSGYRVFGGVNGMYGTGIQGMVERGDKWENESEIAEVYINNMGAIYGSEKTWGDHHTQLLRAVLHNTDVVVQPRQSNTWGALSLDHVYEFAGGMNLAVRNITGKDPDAYFADYRNRNNVRMQDMKEAVGVEARTTILNPAYIKEQMKGQASSAAQFSEVVKNTYAWNVMKPEMIDKELWDQIYDVYVQDKYNVGIRQFFKTQNPAAMQDMTGVMMESIRKGLWKASPEQTENIAKLHTDLVKEFGASGGTFVTDNSKLQDFISGKVDAKASGEYKQQLKQVLESSSDNNGKSMVMKREETASDVSTEKTSLNGIVVAVIIVVVLAGLVIIMKRRRK